MFRVYWNSMQSLLVKLKAVFISNLCVLIWFLMLNYFCKDKISKIVLCQCSSVNTALLYYHNGFQFKI